MSKTSAHEDIFSILKIQRKGINMDIALAMLRRCAREKMTMKETAYTTHTTMGYLRKCCKKYNIHDWRHFVAECRANMVNAEALLLIPSCSVDDEESTNLQNQLFLSTK